MKQQQFGNSSAWRAALAGVLAALALGGCASYGQRMNQWVGARYSDFLRLTGHPTTPPAATPDARGNDVYLVDASAGSNCTVSVVVDRVGFIQEWNPQGPGCR
jgi:hypothetical protein